MSLDYFMNKTCVIARPTMSLGSVSRAPVVGSWSDSSATRCCVQVLTAKELNRPRAEGETVYEVFFFPGTDVRFNDRLKSVTGLTDVELEVTSVGVDDVGFGDYVRCEARHVVGKPTL
jgi:hypothetical protein